MIRFITLACTSLLANILTQYIDTRYPSLFAHRNQAATYVVNFVFFSALTFLLFITAIFAFRINKIDYIVDLILAIIFAFLVMIYIYIFNVDWVTSTFQKQLTKEKDENQNENAYTTQVLTTLMIPVMNVVILGVVFILKKVTLIKER